MTSINIDIPAPVLTIEVQYDNDAIGTGERVGQILAGGVVIFEKRFTNVWLKGRPDNYVWDDQDAADRTLSAFGEKFKELMSK